MRERKFSFKAFITVILFIAVLAFVLQFYSNAFGSSHDENFRKLKKDALIWLKGVISEDQTILLRYALPEARKYVSESLSWPKSAICRELFYSPKSLKIKLGGTEKVDVKFIAIDGLQEYGDGTWACFYDKFAPEQNWLDPVANPSDRTYCAYFFSVNGRWFTNYNFED